MALQMTKEFKKRIELDFYDLLRKELRNNVGTELAIYPHQLHEISKKQVDLLENNLDIK